MNSKIIDPKVKEFFFQYEVANSDFDVAKLASCYADVFMFGGAQGVQAVKKEDFIRVLPRRKEFFKSAGLKSAKAERIDSTELDANYVLAKVFWRMCVEQSGGTSREIETSATYLLLSSGAFFQIVFQIDHQDLAKKLREPA